MCVLCVCVYVVWVCVCVCVCVWVRECVFVCAEVLMRAGNLDLVFPQVHGAAEACVQVQVCAQPFNLADALYHIESADCE